MNRAARGAAAAVVLAVALTACTPGHSSSPAHGRVVEKTHTAAHTTWTSERRNRSVCTTQTKHRLRKTTTVRTCRQVPAGTRRVPHRTAECWQLLLDTGTTVCVSSSRWRRTHVGDRY
ncbi:MULTISPECIES: hypothetical protein [Streptomyces]|uniref:Lipoprotein n=1 Tax=Streptomyces doudnae TaxID=3075536 RepID=A0ABD5ELZ3_9ACTN|nr:MULTISPECIES: hypothetical protein [unclassified Streptomyces]MDT0435643.1 hypothetical protein [Streptomyces sp. DSM 41981]MYQ62597.1 hypothetical protein [Streptomyces sp. SID4950]SCD40543.1 hypothetical protein GA0115242_1048102 [Streptomyces sp. SolWspMP-5a-2]